MKLRVRCPCCNMALTEGWINKVLPDHMREAGLYVKGMGRGKGVAVVDKIQSYSDWRIREYSVEFGERMLRMLDRWLDAGLIDPQMVEDVVSKYVGRKAPEEPELEVVDEGELLGERKVEEEPFFGEDEVEEEAELGEKEVSDSGLGEDEVADGGLGEDRVVDTGLRKRKRKR